MAPIMQKVLRYVGFRMRKVPEWRPGRKFESFLCIYFRLTNITIYCPEITDIASINSLMKRGIMCGTGNIIEMESVIPYVMVAMVAITWLIATIDWC